MKFQAFAEKTAKDARGLLYFAAPCTLGATNLEAERANYRAAHSMGRGLQQSPRVFDSGNLADIALVWLRANYSAAPHKSTCQWTVDCAQISRTSLLDY